MGHNGVEKLLEKYKNAECSPEEVAWLESWYLKQNSQAINSLTAEELEEDLIELAAGLPLQENTGIRTLWPRIAAAASIIFFLIIGYYLMPDKPQPPKFAAVKQQDAAPGKNQATLTLANGKKIILIKSLNGLLAKQGNTQIKVNAGLSLDYNNDDSKQNSAMIYNTLSTARGQQSPYALVLQDGTKVWLNAASSISYPVAFSGNERKVVITGEVYFEVVHNSKRPFKVIAGGEIIEDIGTHFNVNAYDDEPIHKTTLIEGAVKITSGNQTAILKPGNQAQIQAGNSNLSDIVIKRADVDAVIDWKSGQFIFEDESLESIMRKIARWYDMDITYENIDPHKSFWGGLSRYNNVSKVLDKLQSTGGVHFAIKGRRIIVNK